MNSSIARPASIGDISDRLSLLGKEVSALEAVDSSGAMGYFAQEVLRFYSIAESLRASNLLNNSAAADRQISHVLARSLLEGFFWLVYIFDDRDKREERYAERLDSFRCEYRKFWNDTEVNQRERLEPAGPDWPRNKKSCQDLLLHVRNDAGQKLDKLYWLYRVASFDTHGNSMDALFRDVFGKPCNFSALELNFGFDFMSDYYLGIIQELGEEGALAAST